MIRQNIRTLSFYGHFFSPPPSLVYNNTKYEATRSIAKLHNRLWNFQRRSLVDVFPLREQNMTDRTTTGRQATYKLIQDGETYDNVSYYACVHFKPIFCLGYHEITFDRRFPSHLLQKPIWYIPCRIFPHFTFQIAQKMIQQQFGDGLRRKIKDNGTYNDVSFYMPSYSDADYGTTHLEVLAKNGDAVSVTSTINYRFVSKRQWVWGKRLS